MFRTSNVQADHSRVVGPPIDFRDALNKARASTNEDVLRLIPEVGAEAVAAAVSLNVKVSFSYLLLQLHARTTQQFWVDVDEDAVRCYLTFAVLDQYTDILSHIRTDGFQAASVLASICSETTVTELKTQFVSWTLCKCSFMCWHPSVRNALQ